MVETDRGTGLPAAGVTALRDLAVDRAAAEPLYLQLYTQLRAAVLAGGQAAAGTRLPATRLLAQRLGVSRNTVVLAYQRLRDDGVVRGAAGGGTVVADLPQPEGGQAAGVRAAAAERSPQGLPDTAFAMDVPPVELFPTELWAGLTGRRLRTSGTRVLLGAGGLGHRPLRSAVAGYLWLTRGVRCDPERIVITSGLLSGIGLVAGAVVRPGDVVWCENPGRPGPRAVLDRLGARRHSIPVTADGVDVATALVTAPDAVAAVVSPAHQMPLGVPLGVAARAALVEHARRSGLWLLEHEGDSAFLGERAPSPLLLDAPDRVAHVGTFDSVLFPQLRIGYCVLPDALVDPVGRLLAETGVSASWLTQAVLADFLDHHRFARFLGRVRDVCAQRRSVLRAALARLLGSALRVIGEPVGGHVPVLFRRPADETVVVERANRHGLRLAGLGEFRDPLADTAVGPGLVLGCAGTRVEAVEPALRLLAPIVRKRHRTR